MGTGDQAPRHYRMIEVLECEFQHLNGQVNLEDGHYASFTPIDGDPERVILRGNAYLLNNEGRTIDSFVVPARDRQTGDPP